MRCISLSNSTTRPATLSFGLVHGIVGLSDHLERFGASGRNGDADADREREELTAVLVRELDLAHEPLGQCHDVLEVPELVGDHDELVTPEPPDELPVA